jgi:DNA polymerase I-like protein with 3'-5' exonuclease and polymerase domains
MNIAQLQFPVLNGVAQYRQYQRLSQVALKMQTAGIRIDRDALAKHEVAARARLERFRGLWERFTGVKELGADGQTAQVKAWFWDTKGLPKVSIDKKTKKPKLDTNGALMHYLTEIEDDDVNKAAAALIGYRKAAKGLDYCKQYAHDRVYPSFNVTGTKGSRWSCSGPNIQQLPSRDVKYDFGDGPELVAANMKNIIIPDEGMVLVGSDYSALEVYLQTYLAKASKQLNWIETGKDLHIENARIFFGASMPPDANKKTHKTHREVGKLAFGMVYNVTDHVGTTWKQMKGKMPELTERGVKEMRERYFRAHPELMAWQKRTINDVNDDGFIELGLLARRLYLEPSTRGHNQAMNSQCQTLAGDMLNEAVLAAQGPLEALGGRLVLTWHDSIIVEVPDAPGAIAAAGDIITKAMSGPFPVNGLDAMFVAEPDAGCNLRDMDPLDKYLEQRK